MHGLVVERDDSVRRFLAAALMKAGYLVRSEPSGLLGFAAASVHHSPIDFLVTEEDLGELTGEGLGSMVRLINPKARTLLLTQAVRRAAPRSGVDAVLTKPFTATALWNTVSSMLQTRASKRHWRGSVERVESCSLHTEAVR